MAARDVNPLGRAILAALGIDESNVMRIAFVSTAGGSETVDITFHLHGVDGRHIVQQRYQVKLIDSTVEMP